MKIYTLLFGALVVCPMQAQTVHDWKTTMYFKSIGNRHGLRLFLSPHRKETVRYAWMECGNSDGHLYLTKESLIFIKRILMIRTGLIFRFLLIGKSTDMVLQFMYQPVIHLR